MTRLTSLAVLAASACAALAMPAAAQTNAERQRFDTAQQRFDREYQIYRDEVQRFRAAANRGGPAYDDRYRNAPDYRGDGYSSYEDWRDEGGYDPSRYYRSGNQYQERVLTANDRVYSGNDGRYYCKRSDGTTGLIVGGAAGGILGNVIDGGRSRTVGTLLGGAVGAVLGRSVEQRQSEIRCR
ncbi:glycine zipper 2TM domain-containing protein [Sphingomonas donggukensis]|uniref:17 kDa surface antigen n=1 Tax=Sphingomonas donggukensis TaxID=2949093 RepID=A0ABY4TYV6_9SPHN|nr:glycine zipper 2TM domain-containing protein [Sphingomonas donggukensis]URW76831.1 glycine zipper 2TM domain-containing protein [Sphingomonas donggukensis]